MCLELVYTKYYFNLSETSALKLFQMTANDTVYTRLEQSSVSKYLLVEKCKQCENYRKICYVYREACFSPKSVDKWYKHGFATINLNQKDRA